MSAQIKARLTRREAPAKVTPIEGRDQVISTGSTLLDLAISGGRFERGGIPGGIMVEIFGPSGAGKTVMLCELAGAVQRRGGEVMFRDPEGRLNSQFAQLFDFKIENADYGMPSTVTDLFRPIREWEPKAPGINAVFADSLAALSTKMELEGDDKYGMRRAKEFSEECRKVCRVLTQRNILLVCSNQVRQNLDAGLYGEKYKSPGGEAIGFYSSLRLRCSAPSKITRERKIGGKEQKRVIGIETTVQVYKSSVWEPHHTAPVCIVFDYGIDDVRANLQFVKSTTGATTFVAGDDKVGSSLEDAISHVEQDHLEEKLRQQVVYLWREVEEKFKVKREAKVRE